MRETKFRRLTALLLCLSMCGCQQKEIPTYDLNIISPAFENVYKHYSPQESEEEKYILSAADSFGEYITEETLPFRFLKIPVSQSLFKTV